MEITTAHHELVKKIAYSLKRTLSDRVLAEDLVQAGYVGLLEAQQSFKEDTDASFNTFASKRIRGAILDSLRKGDWTPRSVNKNKRLINSTISKLEKKLQREVNSRDVAKELGLSANEYHKMRTDVYNSQIEEQDSDEDSEGIGEINDCILQEINYTQRKSVIDEAIKRLPEREALILSIYYDEELNLKEVGEVVGVSESRVSQVLKQAVGKVEIGLRGFEDF